MNRYIRAYDGDSDSTLQVRRRIRDALRQAEIPHEDIERLLVSYASDIQQVTVPPPPLPPRVNDSDLATAQAHEAVISLQQAPIDPSKDPVNADTSDLPKNPVGVEIKQTSQTSARVQAMPDINAPTTYIPKNGSLWGRGRRLLIVDSGDNDSGVIIHTFLEWLRVWTAVQGGPWIFKSVSRLFPSFLDESRCRRSFWDSDAYDSAVASIVLRDLQQVTNPYRGSAQNLVPQIALSPYGNERFGSVLDAQKNFDYIFLSHETFLKIINSGTLQDMKICISHSREEKDDQIKILYGLGKFINLKWNKSPKGERECIYNIIGDSLGMKLPNEYLNGPLSRTNLKAEIVYLRPDSVFDPDGGTRQLEECLRKLEQASGCRIYRDFHYDGSQCQEVMLFFVGPEENPTKVALDLEIWLQRKSAKRNGAWPSVLPWVDPYPSTFL